MAQKILPTHTPERSFNVEEDEKHGKVAVLEKKTRKVFPFSPHFRHTQKKTKLRRDLGLGQRGEVKISRIKSELWMAATVPSDSALLESFARFAPKNGNVENWKEVKIQVSPVLFCCRMPFARF